MMAYSEFQHIADLVVRAQKGDEQAGEELVKRFQPLVKSLSLGREGRYLGEDMESELTLRLWELVVTYSGDPLYFAAAARKKLTYARYNEQRRDRARWNHEVMDDEGIYLLKSGDPFAHLEEESESVERALALTDKQARLLAALKEEPSIAKAARRLGITRVCATQRLRCIRKKAEKFFQNPY